MQIKIEHNTLTPADFARLYSAAGWVTLENDQIEAVIKNSQVTFTVYEDDKVIGMARLLGDGVLTFFLKDFVILPEYRGRGIGQAVLEHIEEYVMAQLKDGWLGVVELICEPGAEGFYEKNWYLKTKGIGMEKMFLKVEDECW